jgi:uncharacterized linocin/CFP29 family protein
MNNIWNETIWKGINDEVRKVAGTIRVAQKIFPTIILDNPNIPDDYTPAPVYPPYPGIPGIAEGLTRPFVEISAAFRLTPNQVAYEGSLHTGLNLSKLRARDLAQMEDLIFFQGMGAPAPPAWVTINNLTAQAVANGLLGLATPAGGYAPPIAPINVPRLAPRVPGVVYGGNTFNAVVQGINQLYAQLQPGPFALILEYSVFADAYSAISPGLTITADRLTPLVTGGFFGTAALPPQTGLLVSLGGEPTTLYVGLDATTALAQKDLNEMHFFRVFERVQYTARDPRAFVRLNFA